MTINTSARRTLLISSILLALGVFIGAFGAHGLKSLVTPEKLVTFETGVRYHFYHSIGIFLVGILQMILVNSSLNSVVYSFLFGILFFSFNCYLYVITGVKTFAMIVPIGGFLFVIGWILLGVKILKSR